MEGDGLLLQESQSSTDSHFSPCATCVTASLINDIMFVFFILASPGPNSTTVLIHDHLPFSSSVILKDRGQNSRS